MKYLKQICLILLFSFLGELCRYLIPLAIPASIYGMVLLFVCLQTGIIKLAQIEETADLLLGVMPIFFISPTVSLMSSIGVIKDSLLGVFVTCIVSTAVIMVVVGVVSQAIIRRDKKEVQ